MKIKLACLLLVTASLAHAQPPVDDQTLDAARGGFLSAGGLTFGFGAVMRTYADGALALQTEVVWTDKGQVVQSLTPDGAAALPQGSILHDVGAGQLVNVLMNTESGRQFRQETDITLSLPGFNATQSDFRGAMLAQRVMDDIGVGQKSALD